MKLITYLNIIVYFLMTEWAWKTPELDKVPLSEKHFCVWLEINSQDSNSEIDTFMTWRDNRDPLHLVTL